jgi:DNA-binding FadR family transcriptional regulator
MMTEPAPRIVRRLVADQIADDLRRQILDGELPDGARLPSERDLAERYGVSAPTVREAIRVLTALGLVATRNGSRSVVTASGDQLLAGALSAVVRLEHVRDGDLLTVLGALFAQAARDAATNGSDADLAALVAAAAAAAEPTEETVRRLRDFFAALATASGNPLIVALSSALVAIQFEIMREVSGGGPTRVTGAPADDRIAIADAIVARDADRAAELVLDYHDRVRGWIRSGR